MSCLEHIGDPELGFFFWTFVEPSGGGSITHGLMRCGAPHCTPFYTSSGSRATDTPDSPIWQACDCSQGELVNSIGEFFQILKISVCHFYILPCPWKTHICAVRWHGERRAQRCPTVCNIHPRCMFQWGGDIPQALETQPTGILWWTYPVIRNLSRNDIPTQMVGKKQSIWE